MKMPLQKLQMKCKVLSIASIFVINLRIKIKKKLYKILHLMLKAITHFNKFITVYWFCMMKPTNSWINLFSIYNLNVYTLL